MLNLDATLRPSTKQLSEKFLAASQNSKLINVFSQPKSLLDITTKVSIFSIITNVYVLEYNYYLGYYETAYYYMCNKTIKIENGRCRICSTT